MTPSHLDARRIGSLLRVVSVALLVLSACFTEAPPDASELRLGADVDAEALDPRTMRNTTDYRVVDLIYDGLVELDRDLIPRPALAERWENPEPTVWVFHLRPDVRFHDGTTLDAEDVVYTFRTILDPATQARFRSLYEPIETIEAVDERTVRIQLSEPYAPLLSYLDVGIVPRAYVEEGGNLNDAPVGTGPMRLDAWARGSEIRLTAFEGYWGGPAMLERFTFVVVPDNTARAQAFEAGDLDVIQSPLSPQDIARLRGAEGSSGEAVGGLGITYLNFNSRATRLGDSRVRRALSMLVDQEAIVEGIYEGVDQVATSVLLPASWAFDERVRQPAFDPDGAETLFASIGWRDSDGDGFLDRDGQRLAVEISTHSEDPNRVQAAEFIQAIFREHGVDASLSIASWPAFLANVQEGRHEIALLGWTNIVDPDRLLFGQFTTDGDLNYGGYSNLEVDELLERARVSVDRGVRTEAYRRAAAVLAEEVPYFVLSYQSYQLFHRSDLEIRADPRGFMRGALGLTVPPA